MILDKWVNIEDKWRSSEEMSDLNTAEEKGYSGMFLRVVNRR